MKLNELQSLLEAKSKRVFDYASWIPAKDGKTGTLYVVFNVNNEVYKFTNVSKKHWDEFKLRNYSGAFFNSDIKTNYQGKKIQKLPASVAKYEKSMEGK